MAASDHYNTVQKIYIAFYQRPADPAGLTYWAQKLSDANGSLDTIIASFVASEEAVKLYFPSAPAGSKWGDLVNASNVGDLIDSVYQALFDRAPDDKGKDWFIEQFVNGNTTAGKIVLDILNGAQSDDLNAVNNKLSASMLFTKTIDPELDGADLQATYNENDLVASRDWLAAIKSDPATVPDADKVKEDIKAKIADEGDPINSGGAGSSFTFTAGEDALTGSSGDDTFDARVVSDSGLITQSLQSFDMADGGDGNDTINITAHDPGDVMPTLANIENIVVRAVEAAAVVDLANSTGVENVTLKSSVANAEVKGLGAVKSVSVMNQLNDVKFTGIKTQDLTLNAENAAKSDKSAITVTATKDTDAVENLTIKASDSAVKVTGNAVNALKTVTIDAVSGENKVDLDAAGATVTEVTVSGSGTVELSKLSDDLTKFDASANTGGVTTEIASNFAAVIKGGSGNDELKISGAASDSSVSLGAGDDTLSIGDLADKFTTLDGGAGNDIISITDGAALTSSVKLENFEVLDASAGTGDYDLDNVSGVTRVQIDEAVNGALAGNVKFDNVGADFKLTVASKKESGGDFDATNNTEVVLKDATGSSDTVTLVAEMNDGDGNGTANGNINAQTLKVTDVEKVVIDSRVVTSDGKSDVKSSDYKLEVKLDAAATTQLDITGDASVVVDATSVVTALEKIDASTSTGNVTVDLSAHDKNVQYFGSDGIDTYKASTKGDSVYGGGGADQITFGDFTAAVKVRDVAVYKTATDSQVLDANKDGKFVLSTDGGFDELIKFDGAADLTADRIDLTNFGFTGSQRGLVNVSAKVNITSTDLKDVADLFADASGDRGAAYTTNGPDTYLLIDANKDGNFTAADDMVVKLTGTASLSEANINF